MSDLNRERMRFEASEFGDFDKAQEPTERGSNRVNIEPGSIEGLRSTARVL